MNVNENWERKMDYISMFNGVCLNTEEKLKLEIAFNLLSAKEKMEELWFWGKIYGSECDYFITLGINYTDHYEFPQKTFYYTSTLNYVFNKLPDTFHYHDKDNIENYLLPITGNPAIILKKYVDDIDPDAVDQIEPEKIAPVDEINPEGGDAAVNESKKNEILDESLENIIKVEEKKENFTELSKLAYIIKLIDYDTNVVPQGAFRLIPIHELRRNESFRGLKPSELKQFNKFHHFRPITNPINKEIVETDDAIFRFDFLDKIEDDVVKGSWSIQVDSTKAIVFKNNLFILV